MWSLHLVFPFQRQAVQDLTEWIFLALQQHSGELIFPTNSKTSHTKKLYSPITLLMQWEHHYKCKDKYISKHGCLMLSCDKSSFSHQWSRVINIEREVLMAWDRAQASEQKPSRFCQNFSEFQCCLYCIACQGSNLLQKFSSNISPVGWGNKLQLQCWALE